MGFIFDTNTAINQMVETNQQNVFLLLDRCWNPWSRNEYNVHFFPSKETYNRFFQVFDSPLKTRGKPGAIERCVACFSPCLWSAGVDFRKKKTVEQWPGSVDKLPTKTKRFEAV